MLAGRVPPVTLPPPRQRTLADLAGSVRGPILVVGGGPSAPVDLNVLNHPPALVLSANGHGFRLPPSFGLQPDYTVCVDDVHSETGKPMAAALRSLGVPVIGRHHWADVRVTDFRWGTNSGMTALIAGVMLGGWPVIGVGFDCWQGTETYFHDPGARTACMGRALREVLKQARMMHTAVGESAPIRIVSGPLQAVYPAYDPDEVLGEYVEPDIVAHLRSQGSWRATVVAESFTWHGARVPTGAEIAVSPTEYHDLRRRNVIAEIPGIVGAVEPPRSMRGRYLTGDLAGRRLWR